MSKSDKKNVNNYKIKKNCLPPHFECTENICESRYEVIFIYDKVYIKPYTDRYKVKYV